MRLLSLLGLEGRGRIAASGTLGPFLTSRTAHVAQKVTIEYCRARAGIGWRQLTSEPDFVRALETCRWEAFAAVYPDVAETCQILLRRSDGGASPEATGAGLAAAAADALAAHPFPSHRAGWDDVAAGLPGRLERALLAPPRPVHALGGPTVTRILEFIPYHPRIKHADRDILENGLRLGLCGAYAELERRVDLPALLVALRSPVPAEARTFA